jgi:hypothetical protein
MKEDIMKRAMFAMPLSKESKNSGIMAGFEDDINDMDDEDEMTPMERSPQNPEIMMNTLRGDMRSTDARYMELAQMVGEEAAMETPPEVLAMLQQHFAMTQQPQGGIGALPQGGEMMPPPMPGQDPMAMPGQDPMAMPGQDPMAMQGAPMPMDQGPMMPPGGEGMPGPFPQGGAEQAPPTPDGMPPQQFNIGGPVAAMGNAFMTQAGRFAPAVARTLNQVGPAASRYAQSANAALGRMFMNPQMSQPYLENLRGAGGRYTAEQIARGGNLMQPTFTQGLNQGLNQLSQRYPNAAPVLSSAAAMLAGLDTDVQKEPQPGERKAIGYEVPMMAPASGAGGGRGFIDERYYENVPGMSRGEAEAAEAAAAEAAAAAAAAEEQSGFDLPPAGNDENEAPYNGEGRSAAEDLAKVTGVPPKKLSKIERIRASRDEYAPLFQELMGDNKADMKTNALLMLADAGFKFAGATEPTMAMSLAKSAEGIPKGFAALIAQAKDRKLKLDSAALTQAITDVNAQDKEARDLQLKILDIDGRVLVAQAKAKGDKVTDGGLGGRIIEDKNGSFQGFSIDPNDPSVRSAINSAYTLRDTDNPFVENLGEAPTTVETDKGERIKLGSALRSIDNALQEVNTLKRNFTELYSPGTWFTSQVNNLLVPIGMGLIRPDVDQKKAATTVGISLNRIMKAAASANDSGRVAVQEQEWERETQKALSKPEEFFKNKELTAGSINALEARFRNARQQILTQLGYEKNNYVMTAPNTGTQSDPFNLAGDLDYRNRMLTFLQSTIGKHSDKNATIYIINPKGVREAMSISQLNAIPRK